MRIQTLELIEGAKQARGLTVIIDVLRAFSLECYLYDYGAALIRPIGSIEEAVALHDRIPGSLLVGERNGKKVDGFDFGNTPGGIPPAEVAGKTILHTTSAGTQGIINAVHAERIITGSLVNAAAVAKYIQRENPEEVSLVCMGFNGVRSAPEDVLCAEYIRSILEGREMPELRERIQALPTHGAEHFFNPRTQDVFPEEDFWLCMQADRFPFVLRVEQDEMGFRSEREMV